MKQNRRFAHLVGAFAIPILAISACSAPPSVSASGQGGSASDTFQKFDEMAEAERMTALVQAAEEEGRVVAHLRSDEVGPDIEKAFEAKYEVDLVILNPGNTQSVQQQVFEEARAGRTEADVVEVFKHEIEEIFTAEDVIAPIPEFLGSFANPDRVSEHAIETHSYPFPIWWNTNAVSGSDIPTSLADLNDPRWDGRLVMMTNNVPWYITTFQTLVEDEGMAIEEFESLMKGIAEKSDKTNSANPAVQGIASQQYWATPSGALVSFQRVKDLPADFQPAIEPVPVIPAAVGLMKDAPHPAAAMLFTHWYITEGLDITVEEHFIDYHDAEGDLEDIEVRRLDSDDLSAPRLSEWREAYNNLLSGRNPVVPEYARGN